MLTNMTLPQINQRKNAGLIGGQAVLERYGIDWLKRIGKRGGRPRLKDIELLRQQKAFKAANKENQIGGMDSRRSENLGQLKRLVKLKYFGTKS
ncbi:hypothetical protein DA01_03615 [Dehalococcoides mccartyi]|uniref:Uncharacterized protein n=1 Tax=Dehalococcoides mccartyi TaxID=61435 RepID=A0A0V8LYW5_9CHLR|nr:hypothetical protein [Dehalococcoides mccartyi]KSV16465.1 hypothetical protein DA01_03615 [Dehalococcoides mccartyi]